MRQKRKRSKHLPDFQITIGCRNMKECIRIARAGNLEYPKLGYKQASFCGRGVLRQEDSLLQIFLLPEAQFSLLNTKIAFAEPVTDMVIRSRPSSDISFAFSSIFFAISSAFGEYSITTALYISEPAFPQNVFDNNALTLSNIGSKYFLSVQSRFSSPASMSAASQGA